MFCFYSYAKESTGTNTFFVNPLPPPKKTLVNQLIFYFNKRLHLVTLLTGELEEEAGAQNLVNHPHVLVDIHKLCTNSHSLTSFLG